MSPSFHCVSGVSNKHNLGKLYFDERENVKKKKNQPDLLSALISKLKREESLCLTYFTCSFKEQQKWQTHLNVFRLPAFTISGISGKENNLNSLDNVF